MPYWRYECQACSPDQTKLFWGTYMKLNHGREIYLNLNHLWLVLVSRTPSTNTFMVWATSNRSIQTTLQSCQPTGSTIFQKHCCLLQFTEASFIQFWKSTSSDIQHLYKINEFKINSSVLAGRKILYLCKLNCMAVSTAIKYRYKFVCLFQHWAKCSWFYSGNVSRCHLHCVCTASGIFQRTGKK